MEPQSITQTINVQIGDVVNGASSTLANTGSSTIAFIAIGLSLIVTSLLIWHFGFRRTNRKLNFRSLGLSIFALLAVAGLSLSLPSASAAPTLTLAANQETITINVPKGDGSSSATTAITSGTANTSGYTLTAALEQPEPGIDIGLSGGDVTSKTALKANETPLTLKTTSAASSSDTTELTLHFTIDSTVTSGTKQLKLAYKVADNAATGPVTMQDMTASYCQNTMTTYDGTNEDAVVTLNDPRGDGQTYRVAKLADGNCWMLDNLKLGSTSGATALTPADSNVGANFSLPQLATTGTADADNPGAYGPVPGDTGAGATNYGYLYNWSAVTAGESRTSHDGNAGNAPYSICPANWRLPIGYENTFGDGDPSVLDVAFGGTGVEASSGEPNIAKWQSGGPFKGTLAGYWSEGFGDQGGGGYLWSSSAYPGNADYALGAGFFSAAYVSPVDGVDRDIGIGVRCLLN
jgi:uncharacterized protein (TIGR02145 family)/LPXTG-motif cell wall-anchored protein